MAVVRFHQQLTNVSLGWLVELMMPQRANESVPLIILSRGLMSNVFANRPSANSVPQNPFFGYKTRDSAAFLWEIKISGLWTEIGHLMSLVNIPHNSLKVLQTSPVPLNSGTSSHRRPFNCISIYVSWRDSGEEPGCSDCGNLTSGDSVWARIKRSLNSRHWGRKRARERGERNMYNFLCRPQG